MTHQEFSIRRGRLSDAAAIAEHNRQMAEETEGLRLDIEVLLPGVVAALLDETQALYFVAEAEGMVVGQVMVTFEWSDWRNGSIWWLQSVYVTTNWRRRGVFRRLYDHVLCEGKAAGAAGFRLYVEEHNETAQEVYRRLGMGRSPYLVMQYLPEAATEE